MSPVLIEAQGSALRERLTQREIAVLGGLGLLLIAAFTWAKWDPYWHKIFKLAKSRRRMRQLEPASLAEWPYPDATRAERMLAMALRALSAEELAQTRTLFASFMGHVGTSYQTLAQLRAIYGERRNALPEAEDEADDLRVDRFIDDMAGGRWNADVVMRLGVFDAAVLVIDGIHRGIAYLTCIEKGIGPERLPALLVDC